MSPWLCRIDSHDVRRVSPIREHVRILGRRAIHSMCRCFSSCKATLPTRKQAQSSSRNSADSSITPAQPACAVVLMTGPCSLGHQQALSGHERRNEPSFSALCKFNTTLKSPANSSNRGQKRSHRRIRGAAKSAAWSRTTRTKENIPKDLCHDEGLIFCDGVWASK